MPTLITENGSIDYNKYTKEYILSDKLPIVPKVIRSIYNKFNIDKPIYIIYNAISKNDPSNFSTIVQEFIDKIPDKPQSDIILCNPELVRSAKNYPSKSDDVPEIIYFKSIYMDNSNILKDIGFRNIFLNSSIDGYMAPYMIYYNESTNKFVSDIKSYLK